ncbi:hypothetical protein Y032_0112g282 [Ancylostoma ceylanicum]|uniref:Uncharacterized protein n=1 Tax=Ancylostoma ceylanicum TaxID=53326 RepID=A0A016TDQ5_9BILA|nr:hypothetical protein Y032_0112g282 [Ancylostoma ceylanicum]
MFIGCEPPRGLKFHLGNYELKISHSVQDLGIIYTDNLRFDEYIAKKVCLAYARSNFIFHAFSTRKVSTLFKLFCAYVRPILEYCTPLWSPSKQKLIDTVENVQRKFTSRIFARNGLFHIPYPERLSRLNSTSLTFRRIVYNQCLLFKIMSGTVEIDMRDMFTFSNSISRTRGHQFRFSVDRARSQQFHDSFLIRAVRTWNNLPDAVVNSSSPSSFCTKLEFVLKQRGFY